MPAAVWFCSARVIFFLVIVAEEEEEEDASAPFSWMGFVNAPSLVPKR